MSSDSKPDSDDTEEEPVPCTNPDFLIKDGNRSLAIDLDGKEWVMALIVAFLIYGGCSWVIF